MRLARSLFFASALAWIFTARASRRTTTELLNRMKAMEDRIKALEAEVQTLKGQPAPRVRRLRPRTPVLRRTQEAAAAAAPQLGGAGGAAAKALNPDVSVIGDFVGAAGNHANRPTPSLEMHESELGLQEIIDPYARADFFITFGEHGVDLEEGYLTFTALPAGLQLGSARCARRSAR